MSMLDHVVSAEHDRLSINRKSGASRLVVVVECSPHEAKLPQITNRLLCLYSAWTSSPICCDCVSGFNTKTIWHGSGHRPKLFHMTTRDGSASSIAMFCKKFSISLYMDTSHRSRIAPCEDATAFGVTGMLLALITTLDFLSGAFFFDLDDVIVWNLLMVNNFFASFAVRKV